MNSDVRNDSIKPNKLIESNESKYFMNYSMDIFGYSLVFGTVLGSAFLFGGLEKFYAPLLENNPGYQFPSVFELLPGVLLYFIPIILAYYGFLYFCKDWAGKVMDEKVKKGGDLEAIEINKIKICNALFKCLFYISSSLFGYICFRNEDFFPTSLGGSGDYSNIFAKGYPDYLYFERKTAFNNYYQFNLSFVLFDFYLLLSHPMQSDFLFMVTHHISTLSLVLFSFITNYSKCGLVIYFFHYVSDILAYFTRMALLCQCNDALKVSSAVALIIIFIYTRLFVFFNLLHEFYYNPNIHFTFVENSLFALKVLLFILHIMWTVMIIRKILNYAISKNIEDIYKVKKRK